MVKRRTRVEEKERASDREKEKWFVGFFIYGVAAYRQRELPKVDIRGVEKKGRSA